MSGLLGVVAAMQFAISIMTDSDFSTEHINGHKDDASEEHVSGRAGGDNESADQPINVGFTETVSNLSRRNRSHVSQRRPITTLDLVSKWRPLAVCDRRYSSRSCAASSLENVNLDTVVEPSSGQLTSNFVMVEVAVRSTGQKLWRVVGKYRCGSIGHDISELVCLDPIPGVEQKHPAWPKHTPDLRERLRSIRKEHDSELAHHHVKRAILEWQVHDIGLTPENLPIRADGGCVIDHWLIQI